MDRVTRRLRRTWPVEKRWRSTTLGGTSGLVRNIANGASSSAAVAHDLMTPLASIKGTSRLGMPRGPGLDPGRLMNGQATIGAGGDQDGASTSTNCSIYSVRK
jgi:hypothetical protein